MKQFLRYILVVFMPVVLLSCSCGKQAEPGSNTASVESVSLNKTSINLTVGQSDTLYATVLPANAENKTVGWTCKDADIASVTYSGSTAVVTGNYEGTTTVTVTTLDGAFTDKCEVTVAGVEHQPKTPSGAGWTKTAIMDGIDMYTFIGTDKYVKKPQSVYIADVDLAKYELKFSCDNSRHSTSAVMKLHPEAVITMNGAYETSSVYIRVDGKKKYAIENDLINGTKVPNWKNDGAICKTTDGKLEIVNTIFRNEDAKGSGSYGETLKEQRAFYINNDIKRYTDVFSSAPLLIDNYKPLGRTFVPIEYQSLSESALQKKFTDSEGPYHHQGSTHPRTAVALTCHNHLLMIVADGRFSQADGFSSHALTSFLIDAFDPQYALNMDGGGSTALCVVGQGDPDTHVVNHPAELVDGKRYYDHKHEREVTSHFYVVKK